MLKPGDQIQVSRNGVLCYIDTVLKVDETRGIAFTKQGKRFAAHCKILRPLRGLTDYNYNYQKIIL